MKGARGIQYKVLTLAVGLSFLLLLALPDNALADTPEEIEYYEILEGSMFFVDNIVVVLGTIAQEYANENITKADAISMLNDLHITMAEEYSIFVGMSVPDTYVMVDYYWKEALLAMDNSLLFFKDSIEYDSPSAADLSVEYLKSYSYNQDRALEFLDIWESGETVDDTGSEDDNKVPGFGIELTILAGIISLVLIGMRKRPV